MAGEVPTRSLSPDPPRGRPVGGGGTHRSWGNGGPTPDLPEPGLTRSFLEKLRSGTDDSQKRLMELPVIAKKDPVTSG